MTASSIAQPHHGGWGEARISLTIERPDPRKVLLPAHVLAIDISQVRDVKGVLFAGVAQFMVHGFHPLVESLTNQLLGVDGVIFRLKVKGFSDDAGLLHKQIIVCLNMMIIKSSSCQHHILGCSVERLGKRSKEVWTSVGVGKKRRRLIRPLLGESKLGTKSGGRTTHKRWVLFGWNSWVAST